MTKKRQTFAEIAADVRSRPAEQPVLRPGLFAPGGFSDPHGRLLSRTRDLTPAEAQAAVVDGAVVAFESCGCGGSGGCAPEWFDAERTKTIASAACASSSATAT